MEGLSPISIFLLIMASSLAMAITLRYLKIPVIVSFVLVGLILGPHVLGWVKHSQNIENIAEFGVVLLMFTVGLEFSIEKLWSMRRWVIILGGLQVIGSILGTLLISLWLNIPLLAGFILGAVVAMSSTAIVIKQLIDQEELQTPYAKVAISMLLLQDVAVIPILVFLSSLTEPNGALIISFGWALIKGLIAIFTMLGVGRWILQPLFNWMAKTAVRELFTMMVLFVAVGAAWLTHLFNLSYTLGAFLAGMLLAEAESRPIIKAEIRPFRDLLLALFFISVGMLVNLTSWLNSWPWILLLSIGLMLAKPLLIYILGRLARLDKITAAKSAMVLAQGSEFGFAILSVAVTHRLIPINWAQAALGALLISFLISPVINRFHHYYFDQHDIKNC
jgi:CPA2 family monovalent cation:H+ antiporter-2